MISKSKAINNDTWKQFGRRCALMEYSIEYFDYFSKKENYGGENNINEYNNIYEKAFKDLNIKDDKLKKEIESEINYSNIILRDWIKEKHPNFFRSLETQKYKFWSNVAAEYMVNRIRQGKYKYIFDKWYCCNKYGLWKQNKRDLYLDILDVTENYNIYMFLIGYVSDFKKLGGNGLV